MNTSKIKSYAIQARRDFIKAVTEKANLYGIDEKHIEDIELKGDVAIIGGKPFPRKEGELRQKLVCRIEKDGFEMVMRSAAYTWFNRFAALRYMELHDYLDHGYWVLSNPSGSSTPQIMEHIADISLPGLNRDKIIELQLVGNRDNEVYRHLVMAQCKALHQAMPFLFEEIDSEMELLLPDNLLHSDSPIRKMVTEIPEADWADVEIIGWLYQFYISERKDQVIGKTVKSEDIPAATQLFTPNWIVKYMVQNTLGRMWLATYPESPIRQKMEFYIEPAEQEPEVQAQIDAVTPETLDPEKITFLDPACGSGHILVEAYDLLKEIYLERGYRTREIPRLILSKNLYGLDIDNRAAQLAGFAVLMRARADDRKIFTRPDLKLNIMAIQGTAHLNASDLAKNLVKEKVVWFDRGYTLFPEADGQLLLKTKKKYEIKAETITELVRLFEHGKTFGSLITIPEHIAEQLPAITGIVQEKLEDRNLFESQAARALLPIKQQAAILARQYDCVVTNPPFIPTTLLKLLSLDIYRAA